MLLLKQLVERNTANFGQGWGGVTIVFPPKYTLSKSSISTILLLIVSHKSQNPDKKL